MLNTNTIVSYPALKAQAKTYSRHRKGLLLWTLIFWGVHYGLSYIRNWSLFQPVFAFLDGHPLYGTIFSILRWALTIAAVYFTAKASIYNHLLRRREHPNGVPAGLSREVIDNANSRLEALRAACERHNPFPVQRCPVRVQYLTHLSSSQKKDFLLEWNYDDTAVIPLGSSQALHLRIENERPVIVGVRNVGTDAKPYYQESVYPLEAHEPLPLFRGEGSERRMLVAITYLGGKKHDSAR